MGAEAVTGRPPHLLSRCLGRHLDTPIAGRPAIRSGGRILAYADLARVVARGAAEIAARTPPRARILVASRNQLHVALAFLAALAADRVPVLGDPASRGRLFDRASRLHALPLLDRALDAEAPLALDVVDRWLAEPATGAVELPAVANDAEAFWTFTSGSTGAPKTVVHGHRGPVAAGEAFAGKVLRLERGDVTISTAGLPFVYALGNNLLFPLMAGACAVLPADLLLPTVVAELVRHRATVLVSGPWSLAALVRLVRRADRVAALRALRLVLSAGEPLPAALFHEWRRRFGGEILDNLGSTEMFNSFVSNLPSEARPGSLGRAVPGFELEVGGRAAAPGAQGALRVRGASRALAVAVDDGEPLAVSPDGWCETGDEVAVDGDGRFVFLGRADDRFKVHGRFVAPSAVERVLAEAPGVAECMVHEAVGDDGLSLVVAAVVPEPGASRATLQRDVLAHARRALESFEVPARIDVVVELPRTERGKLLRPRPGAPPNPRGWRSGRARGESSRSSAARDDEE